MLGIYFSGTGNSKYALEIFLQHFDISAKAVSIEDEALFEAIKGQQELVTLLGKKVVEQGTIEKYLV